MTGETAHRDVAKFKLPEDEIFGGWLNLDIGRGLVGWLVEERLDGWMVGCRPFEKINTFLEVGFPIKTDGLLPDVLHYL